MRVVKVSPLLSLLCLTMVLSGGTAALSKSSSAAQTEFGVNQDGEFDPTLAAKQSAAFSNKLFVQAQEKEKAGKLKEAEQLYRQSLAYRERVWGTADPGVIKLYDIIGGLSQKRGALPEAERCYRIILMATIKKYGQGTYEEVDILSKLGQVYKEEKKYVDAAKEYDQICQLEQRKHGPQDKRTVQAALDLANTYLQAPETTADAVDTLKPFAESMDKGGDSSNPLLLPVLDTYAKALRKHKKVELADKIQARADELRKSSAAQSASDKKSGEEQSTAGGGSAAKSADAKSGADKDVAASKDAPASAPTKDASESKEPSKTTK